MSSKRAPITYAEPRLARPYTLTAGRTRPIGPTLALESIVVCPDHARTVGLRHEHAAIAALCEQPRSIAEIAARIGLTVGVARVLVADLLAANHVQVHRGLDRRPDVALLTQVLDRLETL
jgi:hypothetical protein